MPTVTVWTLRLLVEKTSFWSAGTIKLPGTVKDEPLSPT